MVLHIVHRVVHITYVNKIKNDYSVRFKLGVLCRNLHPVIVAIFIVKV